MTAGGNSSVRPEAGGRSAAPDKQLTRVGPIEGRRSGDDSNGRMFVVTLVGLFLQLVSTTVAVLTFAMSA